MMWDRMGKLLVCFQVLIPEEEEEEAWAEGAWPNFNVTRSISPHKETPRQFFFLFG